VGNRPGHRSSTRAGACVSLPSGANRHNDFRTWLALRSQDFGFQPPRSFLDVLTPSPGPCSFGRSNVPSTSLNNPHRPTHPEAGPPRRCLSLAHPPTHPKKVLAVESDTKDPTTRPLPCREARSSAQRLAGSGASTLTSCDHHSSPSSSSRDQPKNQAAKNQSKTFSRY